MTTAIIADKKTYDSPGVTLMPPAVFLTCLIGGGLLEFLIPSHIPFLSGPVRWILALVIGGCGFAFMMIGHETFKRVGTNIPTHQPATTFVVHGAYRYSRNPMYVGGSAWFLGIGLMVGSLWMLAAYIPLGFYLSLYVIPREEAYMERAFGDTYRTYCSNVRRWI